MTMDEKIKELNAQLKALAEEHEALKKDFKETKDKLVFKAKAEETPEEKSEKKTEMLSFIR